MILLFTSTHCTWCDVVKSMIDNESADLGCREPLFEINVDEHDHIAEAYGIMMVPTLVSRGRVLSGVPCQEDLRAFMLQSLTGSEVDVDARKARKAILSAPRKYELKQLLRTPMKPVPISARTTL
ncbi:MAG: thioredoxin family protein [Candidatus Hodarchaeota archaeon]